MVTFDIENPHSSCELPGRGVGVASPSSSVGTNAVATRLLEAAAAGERDPAGCATSALMGSPRPLTTESVAHIFVSDPRIEGIFGADPIHARVYGSWGVPFHRVYTLYVKAEAASTGVAVIGRGSARASTARPSVINTA